MNNFILFLNEFSSYLFTYLVFMIAIVVAALLGIKVRKIKNEKESGTETVAEEVKSI